jgi:hypothetical protein
VELRKKKEALQKKLRDGDLVKVKIFQDID